MPEEPPPPAKSKLEIYLCWSGSKSRAVAEALHDWLPCVLQAASPWYSSEDIRSGAHWQSDIRARLDTAQVGIICLTRSNTTAPWINFEAGALSKRLAEPFVCPYLLDLEPSDVLPPLGMFQGRRAFTETHQLVSHLNSQLHEPLSPKTLETVFDRFWPDLRVRLNTATESNVEDGAQAARGAPEMIAELLDLARAQARGPDITEIFDEIRRMITPVKRRSKPTRIAPEPTELYEPWRCTSCGSQYLSRVGCYEPGLCDDCYARAGFSPPLHYRTPFKNSTGE
jgi:hypothetical protein